MKKIAIYGKGGIGKSTILEALTRILRYQSGSICLDGENIHKMPTKDLAKKNRHFIPAPERAGGHHRSRIGGLWTDAPSKVVSK